MASILERMKPTENPQVVPRPVEGRPGMVQVDATWGTIQSMVVADGVRTIGEVEVMNHLDQGLPIVDGRTGSLFGEATIPGARNIPHTEVMARLDELDHERPTVFFCNGPQCGSLPTPYGPCSTPATQPTRSSIFVAACTIGSRWGCPL